MTCLTTISRLLAGLIVMCLPAASLADELYHSINARLNLMDEVAAYKWSNRQPIEDLKQEARVLDAAANAALKSGVTPASSRHFFKVQIDAAREIQQCWFDRWHHRRARVPTASTTPDLHQTLRPRLIELGNDITARLIRQAHQPAEFYRAISVACLTDATEQRLFKALQQIAHYPHRLAQIRDTGRLRVGTTGDYPPFSRRNGEAAHDESRGAPNLQQTTYEGIDIDLARDLAASLAVKLELVPTSWPGLIPDLLAGEYDLAMSGISRTLARAESGYFSIAYHVGGKTPITRCAHVSRFNSLDRIDRPGVRLIVNPGGTNEKFINDKITRATRILHQDNRTIFDALLNAQADVMITDSIEVQLQTRLHRGLCPSMPGQLLTYQEKGYLMPQDQRLKEVVNLWLEQRLGDGTVKRLFDRHLDAAGL